MVHFCLRDDRQLEIILSNYIKIAGRQVDVYRCPCCGEVTFWDNYEEIKKSITTKLEQAIPVKGN